MGSLLTFPRLLETEQHAKNSPGQPFNVESHMTETPAELLERFLGDRGLGARILFDRVGPGVDPLSPDNYPTFTVDPLAGTPFRTILWAETALPILEPYRIWGKLVHTLSDRKRPEPSVPKSCGTGYASEFREATQTRRSPSLIAIDQILATCPRLSLG